jgi:hypothetical protein
LFIMRPSTPVLQDTSERLKVLHKIHALVCTMLQLNKDVMQTRLEPSTTPPLRSRRVGDKVLIVTRNLFLHEQPNRKLRDRELGPYTIE